MSFFIIFTLGYFVGGVSALILLSLSMAGQRGDWPTPQPQGRRRSDGAR
jgi:hypothetical protein